MFIHNTIRKLAFLVLFLPLFLCAQNYPERPANYVTDEAGVLSEEQQQSLNAKCKSFEDSTSNQVFVFITPSLNGQEMQPLCQEIFHNWQIGKKDKNNGVLIAVFVNDHKFRIHTGYGMEGALPDLLTKKIQDEDMKPAFREGDYFSGIDKGIDKLIYYSAHEFSPDEYDSGMSWSGVLIALYIFNLVLMLVLLASRKRSNKSESTKRMVAVLAWIFLFIPLLGGFGMLILFVILGNVKSRSGGNYSSSSFDSSWSSSDSSSSSSDSDFGGGGGGDSGGGGSDSSW